MKRTFVSQLNRLMNVSRRISVEGNGFLLEQKTTRRRNVSEFHTCAPHLCLRNGEERGGGGGTSDHQRSYSTKVFLFRNPISSIFNWWQLLTLRNEWDPSFDSNHFIYGAKQAIVTVSSLVSNDSFDTLRSEGLLSSKAAEGLKHESQHLDRVSKSSLRFEFEDIQVATVQGVNLQTIVDHRYADIDVLFVATKWEEEFFGRDQIRRRPIVIYVSSRFQREYTEGVLPSWTISSITYRFTGVE